VNPEVVDCIQLAQDRPHGRQCEHSNEPNRCTKLANLCVSK